MTTELYRREPWLCHTAAVEALGSAGIAVPAEWAQLKRRYDQFVDHIDDPGATLAAEIITPNGGGGDISLLRSLALLDELTHSGTEARVADKVRAQVLEALREIYAPIASSNYRRAADRYDTAADQFARCAALVDVDAGVDQLAALQPGQREAYFDAQRATADLDHALNVLLAAASLAGAPPDVSFVINADVETMGAQIAIATDPGKAHRRRVWEGWNSKGLRCGRWGALLKIGVRLQAAKHPDTPPFPTPQPLFHVFDDHQRLRTWDPEDRKELPRGWIRAQEGWYGSGD
jgi:hypothetical protein